VGVYRTYWRKETSLILLYNMFTMDFLFCAVYRLLRFVILFVEQNFAFSTMPQKHTLTHTPYSLSHLLLSLALHSILAVSVFTFCQQNGERRKFEYIIEQRRTWRTKFRLRVNQTRKVWKIQLKIIFIFQKKVRYKTFEFCPNKLNYK
jgi:hypothetical protein